MLNSFWAYANLPYRAPSAILLFFGVSPPVNLHILYSSIFAGIHNLDIARCELLFAFDLRSKCLLSWQIQSALQKVLLRAFRN